MKITNVSHYVSVAGKKICADNIHFIIAGAKLEERVSRGDSTAIKHYKNWLDNAEIEKQNYHKCACCGQETELVCRNYRCDMSPEVSKNKNDR